MKKGGKIAGLFLVLSCIMAAVVPQDVQASRSGQEGEEQAKEEQEAAPQEEAQPGEDLDQMGGALDIQPENAKEPVRVMPQYPEVSWVDETFFDGNAMHGIFSEASRYFYVQEYWDTKYVCAQIEYRASELIEDIVSSLTFSVNDVPVSSCKVGYAGGSIQTVFVDIPVDLLKEGYNSFTVKAYSRLYNEEGCIDNLSNANWLSISEDSFIRCGYELKDHEHKISAYPYPFLSTIDKTGKGLTIAVSDEAADQEVAAAMNLMADLSPGTEKENGISFSLLSDLPDTKATRTILVGIYDNLLPEYQQKIKDSSKLTEEAAVVFTDDDKGNPLLLITSQNEECLKEAAFMLMDEERVSQERSEEARVALGSSDAVEESGREKKTEGSYTIDELSGGGLSFAGPFHQEQTVYLPFSENFILSDAGKATMKFRYSENLDFDRSLVTVYWGDIPVASKKLKKENTAEDELTFSLPSDVAGTSAGSIKIAFDLEIDDMVCTPRQDQFPWAYVSGDSSLYLPSSGEILLNFDSRPSPFQTQEKFKDTLLVISDKPDSSELDFLAQVVGMYGEGIKPYGTLSVMRAENFNEKDADYNIITTGTYKSNSLIKKLNQYLHFSYQEDGESFSSNEQLILSDTFAENMAVLQLLESPYAKNRGILAVTGTTEAALEPVEQVLRDEEKRYGLTKDCDIIDSDMEIRAYRFLRNTTVIEEPDAVEKLKQNRQSLLFTLVATSVMLMLLIAVIIILIRMRAYHRKNDE